MNAEHAIRSRVETAAFLTQHLDTFVKADRAQMFKYGRQSGEMFVEMLKRTELYTWTPPMTRLASASAASYPLERSDIVAHHFHRPHMLWMFDSPPFDLRYRDERQPVDAIMIVPYKDGGIVASIKARWEYSRLRSDEERAQFVAEQSAKADGVMLYALGRLPIAPTLYAPILYSTITYNHDVRDSGQTRSFYKDDVTVGSEVEQLKRFVLASSALMRQRIFLTAELTPIRAERKRLTADGLPIDPVRTIELRTAQARATGTLDVAWSHRWIVSGHWREQWYASLKEHRTIWIPSYVKGPEEKPLVIRPTIYSVNR